MITFASTYQNLDITNFDLNGSSDNSARRKFHVETSTSLFNDHDTQANFI